MVCKSLARGLRMAGIWKFGRKQDKRAQETSRDIKRHRIDSSLFDPFYPSYFRESGTTSLLHVPRRYSPSSPYVQIGLTMVV